MACLQRFAGPNFIWSKAPPSTKSPSITSRREIRPYRDDPHGTQMPHMDKGPKDHMNVRILHFGSEARSKGDSSSHAL